MTVYLDAVWLLNFLLDGMILLLTQWVVRDGASRLRVMGGAFVASLLVPITIFFPDSLINTMLGKAFYSLLIIWCAFGFYHFRLFMKKLLFFYFITFSIGGGLIGVHFLIGQSVVLSESGILTFQTGYGDQVSWLFVGICFPIVWLFTKLNMDKHALEKFRADQLFNVSVTIKGQSFSTIGFMDSGNNLVDLLSRKPVIVCSQQFIANWFSEAELQLLKKTQDELSFDEVPDNWLDRIQLVPYQGVGGSRAFMIVIKPDLINLSYENKKVSTANVLIGINFGELAVDGSYQCLLHPTILKNSVAPSA